MTQPLLNLLRIVLVGTSHPGNIGSTARAMKTMGLSELYLVSPKQFPHEKATALAVGADDILNNAKVCDDLDSALVGCGLVMATSARKRHLSWPFINPRQAAEKALEAAATNQQIALVFGNEQWGLSNDELSRSHYHIQIPVHPEFRSLNLAAAVQVLAYEIRMAAISNNVITAPGPQLATADDMARFYEHLEQTLTGIGFLNPSNPGKLMHRLRRLFSRSQVEHEEVHILRGILAAMDQETQS